MKPATYHESSCRKLTSLLSSILNVDEETAYSMMLFTSVLTDLPPDDEEVVHIILRNCDALREDT